MQDPLQQSLVILFASAVIFAFFCLILHVVSKSKFKEGYKSGQVDAQNGICKVSLVEFEDGERKYYYKDELKDLEKHTVIESLKTTNNATT